MVVLYSPDCVYCVFRASLTRQIGYTIKAREPVNWFVRHRPSCGADHHRRGHRAIVYWLRVKVFFKVSLLFNGKVANGLGLKILIHWIQEGALHFGPIS